MQTRGKNAFACASRRGQTATAVAAGPPRQPSAPMAQQQQRPACRRAGRSSSPPEHTHAMARWPSPAKLLLTLAVLAVAAHGPAPAQAAPAARAAAAAGDSRTAPSQPVVRGVASAASLPGPDLIRPAGQQRAGHARGGVSAAPLSITPVEGPAPAFRAPRSWSRPTGLSALSGAWKALLARLHTLARAQMSPAAALGAVLVAVVVGLAGWTWIRWGGQATRTHTHAGAPCSCVLIHPAHCQSPARPACCTAGGPPTISPACPAPGGMRGRWPATSSSACAPTSTACCSGGRMSTAASSGAQGV